MTLLEKQQIFSGLVADLIHNLNAQGIEVTLGEAWRSPETCAIYAQDGRGIKNSNHPNRLAIDLNLFVSGQLAGPAVYGDAAKLWKGSYNGVTCVWGGDFDRTDIYHFSVEHEGVR